MRVSTLEKTGILNMEHLRQRTTCRGFSFFIEPYDFSGLGDVPSFSVIRPARLAIRHLKSE